MCARSRPVIRSTGRAFGDHPGVRGRSASITSADEFREIAEPLYRRDPVVNTIELTLLRSDRFDDDALLLTVWDDGVAVGAALQTPPYPLACNGIPVATSTAAVANELARIRPDLSGVRGGRDLALAVRRRLAGGVTGVRRHRQPRAKGSTGWGRLRPPVGVSGAAPRCDRRRPRAARRLGGALLRPRRSATSEMTRRGSGSSTTRTQ